MKKNHRKECTTYLAGLVIEKIHKMKANDIKYRVDTIGVDNDWIINITVDKPGSSGISSGLVGVSIIGHIEEQDKGTLWWKTRSKEVVLNIEIFPQLFPNILYSQIVNFFDENKKNIKSSLKSNINFTKSDVRMIFHEKKL